ncbi:MAG: ATP-binding cassette domain-containing protein [Coriobacteriia bacterium]|nr:ATP-binding cassette domain-containing protein [Coriobacteriia bacterium]
MREPADGFVLEAGALRVALPPGGDEVLRGASLALRAGEVVDLAGPSGSGKTTLLRALARLLPGTRGELALDGVPAAETPPEAWRARVALVPQLPAVWPGTVEENLTMPWRLKIRAASPRPDRDALRRALAEVGLADVEPERDAARLSVGQKARVTLLRAALTSPRVLLLDEPDANLDDDAADAVAAFVARFAARGGAVLRVRHLRRGAPPHRRLRLRDGQVREVRGA